MHENIVTAEQVYDGLREDNPDLTLQEVRDAHNALDFDAIWDEESQKVEVWAWHEDDCPLKDTDLRRTQMAKAGHVPDLFLEDPENTTAIVVHRDGARYIEYDDYQFSNVEGRPGNSDGAIQLHEAEGAKRWYRNHHTLALVNGRVRGKVRRALGV